MARARTLTITALLWAGAAVSHAQAPEDCPPVEPGTEIDRGAPTLESGEPTVLVLLPKGADGGIAAGALELAPGARIVESRWSALLCATVARIAGPPGSDPTGLIARLPENAAAVNDDVYEAQAGAGERAAGEPSPAAARPDPYRPLQWAHDALGVDAAHAVTRGAGARVAVLDSRAHADHPELRGIELIPADGAGAPALHGTLVAGIIGAATGNGFGIASLAPDAKLLSIPVCKPSAPRGEPDLCRLYAVLTGLDQAWEARAQVVNVSLVGPANRALERAVRRLDTLGVAVVAAAGNRAEAEPAYPAAYPWAIGVAATDRAGALAESGAAVDLTAPGVEIVSTAPGGGFTFASGSSLAAAHASGALALLSAASGGDVAAARRALFAAAQTSRGTTARHAALAPLCGALAQLGKPCPPTR